jgi:hypothetical protein
MDRSSVKLTIMDDKEAPLPEIHCLLRGGPRDGRSLVVGLASLHLAFPAWTPTAFPPPDPDTPEALCSTPDDVVYARAAGKGTSEDPVEYYHDIDLAGVASTLRSGWNWRKAKPGRYWGYRRPMQGDQQWLSERVAYLAAKMPDGRFFFTSQLLPEDGASVTESEIEQILWGEFERELEYQLAPTCVVPGCKKKGIMTIVAAEYGRLAGRPWETGDEIRICPEHEVDLFRVKPGGDEDLPAWLAADAFYPSWTESGCGVIMGLRSRDGMRFGGAYMRF